MERERSLRDHESPYYYVAERKESAAEVHSFAPVLRVMYSNNLAGFISS